MSIILEALKKSERERKRTPAPEWAYMPAGRADKGTPMWMPVAVGVLATLVVVLAWGWWSSRATPAAALSTEVARSLPPADTPAVPTPDGTAGPIGQEGAMPTATESTVRPLSAETQPNGTTSAVDTPATAGGTQPAGPRIPATLPSLPEARHTHAWTLPDLHLDLHVYSGNPFQSFVSINGQRLGHGDLLNSGPRVVEILSNGVVLEYRQQRFALRSN